MAADGISSALAYHTMLLPFVPFQSDKVGTKGKTA